MQLFHTILIITVFLQLFLALSWYMFLAIRNFYQESARERKARRGITYSDMVGLVSASPDAMIIVDRAGLIVQANSRATALFGYIDLCGQRVESLLPESLRTMHQRHRAQYQAHPRVRTMGEGINLQGVRADGSTFGILVSLSPITIDNEQHTIAIIRAKG